MISFILANVAGFYLYFVCRLQEIRRETRAALKDYPIEKLQCIVLTRAQYQETKNDDGEIEWQGYMYDVARLDTVGNDVTIFALRDEAETSLLDFLNHIVEVSNQDEQTPPSTLTEYLTLIFTVPEVTSTLSLSQLPISEYCKHSTEVFSSLILEVHAPPPRT